MKRLILGLALGASLLGGCNDDVSLVGPSIQPGADRVKAYTDTFEVEMSTIKLDSVYARTVSGLLGELYDPRRTIFASSTARRGINSLTSLWKARWIPWLFSSFTSVIRTVT